MFTGIIEATGKIKAIKESTLYIEAPFLSELIIGQSVAHDGVCLTVTEVFDDCYSVDLIPETFKRTHFGEKQEGDLINLERCMEANGRFDGHIVQGHCDFVGTIESINPDGNSNVFKIQIPEEYAKYFVEKGSVTLNGISLTVIEAENNYFTVGIIPHTFEITNLHTLGKGSKVNIETDVFAKYFVKTFHTQ